MTMPHLDDESLSAAFDGEATPAERAHLASCPHCQAALGSLAAVARAVGAPVTPLPSEAIDAAIARALSDPPLTRAAGPVAADGAAGAAAAAGVVAAAGAAASAYSSLSPTPGPRRATEPPRSGPIPRLRRGKRQPPAWILGVAGVAAAAALVAVVAIAGRSRPTTTATSPALSAGGAGASTNAPAGRTPGLAADLGDQSDPGVVARLVLAAPRSLGDAARNAAPVTSAGSSTAPAASGAAPQLALAATPCASEARVAVGVAVDSPVQYAASLRWRGQEAVVVVFPMPSGLVGVIMKASGCSELVVLPTP
jgi:hypothetical protein